MSDVFPGLHVVGDGQDWFKAVGEVHDWREGRSLLATNREDVLARINTHLAAVSDKDLVRLLRDLELVAVRSDEALAEIAALNGVRPSQGLYARMRAILDEFP